MTKFYFYLLIPISKLMSHKQFRNVDFGQDSEVKGEFTYPNMPVYFIANMALATTVQHHAVRSSFVSGFFHSV